jgi:chemotaxis signal transduction protein
MTDSTAGYCVLLPCAADRCWVVPQRCLGEIVTVITAQELPPQHIEWRGECLPLVDFGRDDAQPWRDPRAGTGLVAIVLGQRDEAVRYFGVAVRGGDLSVARLAAQDIEDLPEPDNDYATAAFRMNGKTYQVPDLLALQRALGADGNWPTMNADDHRTDGV